MAFKFGSATVEKSPETNDSDVVHPENVSFSLPPQLHSG